MIPELTDNKQRNNESEELYRLINDARRFILSQKGAIEIALLQAYASVLVFSPSGSLIKRLFNGEEPNWIELKPKAEMNWDPCLQTLEGHDDSVNPVVFSHDGQRLALGSVDKTVKIWDFTSGDWLKTCLKRNDVSNNLYCTRHPSVAGIKCPEES